LLVLILAIVSGSLFAQAPQYFKFQAVVRDVSGEVIANQIIGMKIGILKGSADGQVVYSEIHVTESNPFGLVNLAIGSGVVESGVFSSINWGDDNYYVQIEVDESGASWVPLSCFLCHMRCML